MTCSEAVRAGKPEAVAVMVIVRLVVLLPMPICPVTVPFAAVLVPLGMTVAPASTLIPTTTPGITLRRASSAVAVAMMSLLPLFGIVGEASVSNRSEGAPVAVPPVSCTCNWAVLVMPPLTAVTVIVRLLRSDPMPTVALS